LGDRIEEGTQRKGAEARRLAENGGRLFGGAECWDGLKWEDEKKEGVTGTMGSRSRKVVERQLCGSSEETPEPGRYRPWGFLQTVRKKWSERDLSKKHGRTRTVAKR
jgi:hypothetical protein